MTEEIDSSVVCDLLEKILRFSGLRLAFHATVPAAPDQASLRVHLHGLDEPLLLQRNAELLHALEHLTAKALRLQPEQHHLLRFEAGDFKAAREAALHRMAEQAVAHVRQTGHAFQFPPMSSWERRLLHLELARSGLHTASEGQGPHRRLVVSRQAQHQ